VALTTKRHVKTSRWHSCNVLDARRERRLLWQLARDGEGAKVVSERVVLSTDPLPARQVGRSLRDLWQPKLNIAWLPAQQVFLRVLQLPVADERELAGMVELQLEKLSPLPVAQIVWTFDALPAVEGQPRTVIVVIAPRSAVEAFLGDLEGAGYLADRLEFPQLQDLRSVSGVGDGVWIHPREEGGRIVALVAWRHGGGLQSLNLLTLPGGAEAGPHLVELLQPLALAGEMEGWLSSGVSWHLVAEEGVRAHLESALREYVGGGLEVQVAPGLARLAAMSASAPSGANLVPPEHVTRYRQQFIDRLWMRALGGLGLVYLFGVIAYLGALQVVQYQKDKADLEVALASGSYTNALQLKAKVQVLQEQVNLKFAALDCWMAASEALPAGMNLTQLTFQRGKKLGLFGTVPAQEQTNVTAYIQALSQAEANGQPLFSQVMTKSIQGSVVGQGNRPMNWSIECEIRRSDL